MYTEGSFVQCVCVYVCVCVYSRIKWNSYHAHELMIVTTCIRGCALVYLVAAICLEKEKEKHLHLTSRRARG